MSDAFIEGRVPLITSKSANVNQVDDTTESFIKQSSISLGLSPTKPSKSIKQTVPFSTPSKSENVTSEEDIGLFAKTTPNMPPPNMSNHDHVIQCKKSIALLLGRAKAIGLDEEDESLQSSESKEVVGGIPIKRFSLPNTAKHVSRDHCIIYHTPFNGSSWAVKILGQNGLIVDGKRHRAGSIIRLISGQSILDFFGGAKALFIDFQKEKEQSINSEVPKKSVQDGRSPLKKRTKRSIKLISRSTQEGLKGQENTRMIGNMNKRPLGAPLSPPTSSPARFNNAPSSPSIANSIFGKRRNILPSSSPGIEDEEDDEDMLNSSRAASPTLERRANKPLGVDDSGVLLCDDNQDPIANTIATPTESEDEASQALAIASKATPKTINKRKLELLSNRKASKSPAGTPQRTSTNKNVKFNVRAGTPSNTNANTNNKNIPTLAPIKMQSVQKHFRSLVCELAQTYDLQGLLAGVIVFHRTATISATEAVRSVLSSNPGLMKGEIGPDGKSTSSTERGSIINGWTYEDIVKKELIKSEEADKERVEIWQRKAWRERLEECLMEGECFGIIQRAGKDASGNPLECWYYYDKDLDLDSQRAANLGPFVKPMRAALKTHKPIFWRKSAYGTTSDDVKALQLAEGQQQSSSTTTTTSSSSSSTAGGATESQWGSSGSTLNSALLSGQLSKNDQNQSVNNPAIARLNPTTKTTRTIWEETQFEENEQTWDKEGDLDFEMSNGRKTKRRK